MKILFSVIIFIALCAIPICLANDKKKIVFCIVSAREVGNKNTHFMAPNGTVVNEEGIAAWVSDTAQLYSSDKRSIEIQLVEGASASDLLTLLKLFSKYKIQGMTVTTPGSTGCSIYLQQFYLEEKN